MPAILIKHWKSILIALAVAMCFYAGWHARGVSEEAGRAVELRQQIEQREKQEQEANRISAEYQAKLAAMQEKNRELNRKVAHETSKPEYSCPLGSDGVRLHSEAIADPAATR